MALFGPLAALCLGIAALAAPATGAPPNIILFVVDDMGHANIGYHNPDNVQTPTFDNYATQEGIRLERHYVFYYCSPTRSSLMSGRLPMHVTEDNGNAGTVMGAVPTNMTTIASKLQKHGYNTVQIGKWHLGNIRTTLTPHARGFDTSLGYLGGAEDHYTQTNGGCGCGGVDIWDTNRPGFGLNGTYGAFTYNRYASAFLANQTAEKPFFMYFALQNMHAPNEVPARFSNLYPSSKYASRFQIEQGMASCADEVFANLTKQLKSSGLWDNTLIVMTSDNGGPAGSCVSGSAANNFPLRGGKRTFWEGGVRVNSFVTGGLAALDSQRGKTLDGYVHAADWYPTFANLAGVSPHDKVPGFPDVDGMDMWPYLTGEVADSPRTEIPLGSGPRGALIVGDYKLIQGSQDYDFWQGPVFPNTTAETPCKSFDCKEGCLFNIKEDPSEYVDLAATQPAILKQLQARKAQLDATAFNPNRGTGNKAECCAYTKSHGGFSGPYYNW